MYAPQISYDPSPILRGVMAGGDALARGIMDYKQMQTEGKAADALRAAMKGSVDPTTGQPANAAPFGISDDEWKTMGARDRSATAGGWMKATALQQAMAQMQQSQARAQSESGDARLLSALDQQVNPPANWNGPMTPDESAIQQTLTPIQKAIIHSGAQMGPNQRGSAAAIYRTLLPQIMGTGGNGESFFDKNTVVQDVPGIPGMKRIITGPKTSEIFRDSAAVDQTAQPVQSPDGSVQGYNIPTGNAKQPFKFTPIKSLSDDQRVKIVADHEKAIDGLTTQLTNPLLAGQTNALTAINTRIGQHQAAIAALNGKAPTPNATPQPAARIPVWDKTGKQFTVPASQKDDAVQAGYLLSAPQ